MLAPTRKEPLYRASLVHGECSDLEEVASAMRDYDFVARLLERLEMPGEGELYPHDANPYPADPRDVSFAASIACAPCTRRRTRPSGRRYPPPSPARPRRAPGPTPASTAG